MFGKTGSVAAVPELVTRRAKEGQSEPAAVAQSLIEAACAAYRDALAAAGAVMLASEHSDAIARANERLDFVAALATLEVAGLSAGEACGSALRQLVEIITQWGHFRKNPGESELRQRELGLLSRWTEGAGDNTPACAAAITKALDGGDMWGEKPWHQPFRELLERLAPHEQTRARQSLIERDGVRLLFARETPDDRLLAILDPNVPIWQGEGPQSVLPLLRRAPPDPAVQVNAVELLDLFLVAVKHDRGTRAREAAKDFLRSGRLADVWAAATATPLQFRQLQDLRKVREALIRHGAPEGEMPVPDWLQET